VTDPSELTQAIFAAINAHDAAALETLVHPDAKLELAIREGKLVEGRDAILAAWESVRQGVYDLRADELHPVSDEAVIVVGRLRHPISGGFADSACVWLCEYRDGMLYRQRLFRELAEARGTLLTP
jgi:hypothetical protein